MHQDFLQEAKNEISEWLSQEYKDIKFTVKFGGEFFVAGANRTLTDREDGDKPCCVSHVQPQGNKLILYLSHDWLEDMISKIDEADCEETDLALHSQVKRLEKQIEFGLCGGEWEGGMHLLARDILYMMHTKSASIRSNIVKKCAREYNKLQRQGRIPGHLVEGYKNALCQISKLRG
jgi:hypothetical protein